MGLPQRPRPLPLEPTPWGSITVTLNNLQPIIWSFFWISNDGIHLKRETNAGNEVKFLSLLSSRNPSSNQ